MKGEKKAQVYDLGVQDRFVLFAALPAQGDISTIRILRELKEALGFSEAENRALDIGNPCKLCSRRKSQHKAKEDCAYEPNPTVMVWDGEKAKSHKKGIQIGPLAFTLIHDTLKKLDSEKKLTESHLDLYERFCEQKA